MVAFASDERLKRAVDATLQATEGATGTSQQADQPSVTSASAQASTLLPVMERHASSPDALHHEFDSYLREPKIVIAIHRLSYMMLMTIFHLLVIICR